MDPCELTTYSHTLLAEKLNPSAECYEMYKNNISIDSFPAPHPLLLPKELETSDLWSIVKSDKWLAECRMSMKGTSILHVKTASGRVNVISQRKTLTFGGQLAQFGKKHYVENNIFLNFRINYFDLI
jgi:hypothetical protein